MTLPSSRITIVGLGPGNPALRTVGTQRAIDAADRIVLRTRVHPGVDDLAADVRVTDCDDLYEGATHFDALYPAIADRVLSIARPSKAVVYAVPGHPRIGERSVPLVEAGARELGIPVEVLDAVSFLDVTVGALGIDPLARGLHVEDAEELAQVNAGDPFASGRLGFDPTRPLLVAQLYNKELASAVKIALSRVYPDDHLVALVVGAGVPGGQAIKELSLFSLDRQHVDHLTSLWVPPLGAMDAVRSPESVTRLVARLRSPDGCPWDRDQSSRSLRNSVLEEAYEVVDAIDADDPDGLAEELGDLLLLITMQAQIAEENGVFRIEDVFEGISRKLIRRHPHVFGSVTATTPDAVVATWEAVKESERAEKASPAATLSPIDRLPRAMPITRKVVEILAPRADLAVPYDADAGDALLAAVRALIEQGIEPELALEASLRNLVDSGECYSAVSAPGESDIEQGRESA